VSTTSFNGTTFKWAVTTSPATTPTIDIPLDSLTFGGGDVGAVDFTAANSTRKRQVAGLRAPFQITVAGKAQAAANIPAAGTILDWAIVPGAGVGTGTTYTGGTNWYVESVEVTGSVDEANTVNITIIEGVGASNT